MKTSTLLLITAMTAASHSVLAETDISAPPSGPYRSLNASEDARPPQFANNSPFVNPQNRDMPNYVPQEIPEWVKQQQTEMENWRQQQNRQPAEIPNQSLQQRDMPEWVKQRQAQMEQWMQQTNIPPPQNWNNPAPQQWNNNNQFQAMPNPNYDPNAQANRMQQYFPSARGPVYGPGVPPPGFQNQPGYQPPQFRNAYPPAWR